MRVNGMEDIWLVMREENNEQIGEALAACNEMCLKTYHKPVQTYETGELVIAEQCL